MATPDANTFQFTLSSPSPDFLIPFGTHFMSIYPHELVDQDLIATQAIGTGPLIITEIEEGSHIKFIKNPDYWEKNLHGREPWLDGLEFRIMRDSAARIAAYRTGDIDYCYSWPSTPRHAAELLDTNPDYVVLADPVVLNSGSWGMNLTDPRFADPRVRQALHLGFNRDLAIQIIYDGTGTCLPTAAWPFVYDETPSYEAGTLGPWWTFDPGEAKSLLAAAGQENLEFRGSHHGPLPQHRRRRADAGAVRATRHHGQLQVRGLHGVQHPVGPRVSTPRPPTAGRPRPAPAPRTASTGSRSTRSRPTTAGTFNDAEIDAWADAQRIDLDPDSRSETQRKIFDKLVQEAYRLETIHTFSLSSYPPWLRFARFNGPYISYHYFYRFGDSFTDIWLDK